MEKLTFSYEQLLQAYSRLEYMTKTFVNLSRESSMPHFSDTKENELITHRDALIKRFEFCYDLTWKFFKQFLKEKYSIEAASPRKVFQDCYQQGVLTKAETEKLSEMIEARNETTHVYDEARADVISQEIVKYYAILAAILKKIQL